ncbi:MAG: tetratricopeptide repeat protein [Gammaproteobacteria bacterium]|nr:MAG: tetratricopeptide repeat protein [Gammaproteobacteria bacterium]
MSLLLDALKQAAEKKQPTKKTTGKKPTAVPNQGQDADQSTMSKENLTLELEEIQEDLEHKTEDTKQESEETSQESKLDTDLSNKDEITEETTTPTSKQAPLDATVEMDHFDPDEMTLTAPEANEDRPQTISSDAAGTPKTEVPQEPEKHLDPEPEKNDQITNAAQPTEAEVTEIAENEKPATSSESSAPSSKPEEKPEPSTNKQTNKTRTMAPENAKIITGQEKKKSASSKYLIASFLFIGVLVAGGFLGYLHYIDQDSQISTNIATLSRAPTTAIKPIDDLSDASSQMATEMQSGTEDIPNQPVSGTIADIESESVTETQFDTATEKQEEITPNWSSTRPVIGSGANNEEQTKQQPGRPQTQTASTTGKNEDTGIAAEELPPTLSSVINSHPFIETKPLEKGPVNIEPAIKIKKNYKDSIAAQHIVTGYNFFNNGNYQLSKQQYMKAISISPDSVDALLGLGAIAIIEEDKQKARDYYTKALELNPQNTTAISAISAIDDTYQNSESTFKQSIANAPSNPTAYFNLGNYYLEQQNWSKALQAFKQANALSPDTPDIIFNIAISLDNLDKVGPAINSYKYALETSKNKAANFDLNKVKNYIKQLELQQQNGGQNTNQGNLYGR